VIDAVWTELRLAARTLRKAPSFAATAALTIALGVGASTAVFSVVYGQDAPATGERSASSLVPEGFHGIHARRPTGGPDQPRLFSSLACPACLMFPTTGTIELMDITTSGIGAISGVIDTNGCDTYE
jgi:hypothetical protein